MENKNMKKLKCNNCKREWNYKGSADYYTSCPNCLRRVKVKNKNLGDK